jgi:hypothetical protein
MLTPPSCKGRVRRSGSDPGPLPILSVSGFSVPIRLRDGLNAASTILSFLAAHPKSDTA